MAEISTTRPWLVRMHHRMRTASFAMVFVATSIHVAGKSYGPGAWFLLALLLLVYPHVQYWRACRAENPVVAEMDNLHVDSVLLGILVAALGFPLWIAVSAMLGTLINNAVNKGWQGVVVTMAAFLGGVATSVAVGGLRWSPATEWSATLFCIGGLTVYILAIGHIAFKRNRQLRRTREKLQVREQELLTANETLLTTLQEVDELHEQLREQANRDPLTGLYNRRYLDSTLERELARCRREGQSLSLILVDIDHFKRINDTYGHQAGDEVLVRLGAMLCGLARAGDVACRYGGEEFLLLMPTMSLEIARERAEELRAAFGAMVVTFESRRIQTTLSVGISAYPRHGISADELIRCADRALYQAKRWGRNRVEVEALDQTEGSSASADGSD